MSLTLRLSLLIALLAGFAFGADWAQWRGPDRSGHVPAGIRVPEKLPVSPRVVWRKQIGDGLASPVVSAGRVFYLDNQQGKETVHAADAKTGEEVWSASVDDAFKDGQSVPGPRCTPAADGDRVYVQSCRGEFQCLSVADGKVIWRVNFVKDFGAVFIGESGSAAGASRHGNTGSPVIDGDRIYVAVGGKGASLVCFDKKSGEVIWKSQNDIPGYAAPIIATIAGVKQIVYFTSEAVVGLDVTGGKLLWRFGVKTSLGRHVTTPVVVNETVMVASFQAGLIGITISKEGDSLKAQRAYGERESSINFSSPVASGGFLYGLGPAKNLICVDTRTGKQSWSKEGALSSSGGQAYASFMVMGQNILILTDDGQLILMAADPKQYREISRAQACGQNWCSPAYADGRLYLRDARELRCLELLP